MILRPGTKLRSAVSSVEIIVVRAPATDVEIACGGWPMAPDSAEPAADATADPTLADAVAVGKRYADEEVGLEVLCIKPGVGTLTCNGATLHPKDAKPLPSSD